MVVLVSFVLVMPLFLGSTPLYSIKAQNSPDVYLGIDVGYAIDVPAAKNLIDRISEYTNFFILGTYAMSMNVSRLNETLQYAYDKGMYFMSFPPSLGIDPGLRNTSLAWLNYTKTNWGNHLVGFLYPYEDEPGGHQIDISGAYRPVETMNKTNYTDAENQFIQMDQD